MDDTDKIIEEDKKQHPKCGYRKQFSKEVTVSHFCLAVVPIDEWQNGLQANRATVSYLFGKTACIVQ